MIKRDWTWVEEDHPRDKDGKFGSGGGGGKKEAKKKISNSVKFGKAGFSEQGEPTLGGGVVDKPIHEGEHTIKSLHAMYEYHKALEEHAKQTGNTAEQKQQYKNANKYYNQAKKIAVKKGIYKTKAQKAAAAGKPVPSPAPVVAPPPPKVEPPKAPAPHLEHGATVKVEGAKSEHGGVLAGTVVGWSKEPGKTAVLQLGKTEATWHENSKLSSHPVYSEWAKKQEAIGKEVAADLGPGVSSTGPMILEHEVKSATAKVAHAEKAKKEAAQQAAAKEVEAAKSNPDLVHKDAHKWGIIHFKQWETSLTPQEHSAVKGYTNSEYSQVNGYLRFGHNADKSTVAKVEAIQSALLKSPGLPHAMLLKRGMGGTFPIAAGDVYEDKGFMSTSVGGGHFKRENLLHITAKQGAKGAFMTMSSHTSETEFLLPHGSKMKVTKVETIGAVRHIHGELLPHGHKDSADDEIPVEFPDSGVDLSDNPKFNGEAEDIVIYRNGEVIHNGPEMRRRGGSGR